MEPITNNQFFLATMAGEYDGELPKPLTMDQKYYVKIIQRLDSGGGSSVSPEEIDAAIEDYLNTHDADVVTEAELSDALSGKANASHMHAQSEVTGLETALLGKANASHTHDDRYYTETEIDTALSGKSNTGHTHDDRYYTEAEVDTLLSGKADSSDIPDVSAFITRLVNDLVNYYTKSETYTKAEIDSKVSAIPKFAIKPVNSLPIQDISDTTVYLLTVQNGEQGNMYDEYIYVGNTWEKLGTQTIDLSGYYTAAEVDALLSNLSVSGHTHDDRYYTETEIDGKIQTINTALSGKAASDHTHDDRYYTETEIDNKLSVKSNTGHSHVVADVTGLDSALAGKAAASHSHAQTDITDLDTALAGKSNTGHSHAVADVTGLDSALSGKAPASHTHALADVTGLADALAAKADAAATQTALNAKQDALTAGENITIETVNGELTISATDTTYSAGSGISISNGEISNSAPNVQADWNASGTAAEILNKPTIPNYSNATTSAAGLMSATDKSALNAINAGTQVSLMPSGGIDLVSASNNRLTLSNAVSNFRAIEIRYAMYYTGASTYTSIVRAVNKDGQGDYGNIAALVVRADTAGSLSLYMCNLQLSGSNLTLSAVNNIPSFYVYNVWGYK